MPKLLSSVAISVFLGLPTTGMAQLAISSADQICASETLDYDDRKAAFKTVGWTEDVPQSLKLDLFTATIAIDWIKNFGRAEDNELKKMLANSEARLSAADADERVSFWLSSTRDAVVLLQEQEAVPGQYTLVCSYAGRKDSGSTLDLKASSRFSDILGLNENPLWKITDLSASQGNLSKLKPLTGWHPLYLNAAEYFGPADILPEFRPVVFTVIYSTASMYRKGTS